MPRVDPHELAPTGVAVLAAEKLDGGMANTTWRLELADGRVVVVKHSAEVADAGGAECRAGHRILLGSGRAGGCGVAWQDFAALRVGSRRLAGTSPTREHLG